MPWSETTLMSERLCFIADLERNLYSMTELCERHNISRKTGYKWAERYVAEGVAGLKDRSRAPKRCPHQTEDRVVEAQLFKIAAHIRVTVRRIWISMSSSYPWKDRFGQILTRLGQLEPAQG